MHCGAEFGEGGDGPVEGESGADAIDLLLEGDLHGFVVRLDTDSDVRGAVVLAYGLLTWYLLSAVALPSVTTLPTALGGVLVALALLQIDDGRALLVRGAYYAAATLVGARVLVPLLLAGGASAPLPGLLLAIVHVPTLVAAGALFYAGRWLADRTHEGDYPHPHN